MLKVVLDTNVIVSALIFGGNPDKILNLANEGIIKLIISPSILEETAKVLQQRFNWAEGEIKAVLAAIQEIAVVVQPKVKLSLIKEKDSDNRILECAVGGRSDFIVTGDTKHILPIKEYQGIKILSPAEFVTLGF